MDLAIQIFSKDKTVRSDTLLDSKEFNNQSLTTQAKKGEQLVSIMPANKEAFSQLADDIIELTTENDALKDKISSYDEKWLEESKTKLLKRTDDEKMAILSLSRMKKTKRKTLNRWPNFLILTYGIANSTISFLKEINYKFWKLVIWNFKYMPIVKKMKKNNRVWTI